MSYPVSQIDFKWRRHRYGSAAARFQADANSAWLADTRDQFVAYRTALAQGDADFEDASAAAQAGQENAQATEDVTQAQNDQTPLTTELDGIAADEQTYALAVAADQGVHDVARAEADQAYALAMLQSYHDRQTGYAQADAEYQNELATATPADGYIAFNAWWNDRLTQMAGSDQAQTDVENSALTTWIEASAAAEANQQIDDSAAALARDVNEATAQHVYAYAAADNQWTFDENSAAATQAAADATANAELVRGGTIAAAESSFTTAEYANAATVMASFASALNTPWAQYRSDLAAAESSWAAGAAPAFLGSENTLALDQWKRGKRDRSDIDKLGVLGLT